MPKLNVRNQLLDAALQTLHARGFNGCAVQDITSAAGVPKGSFYNHFESKEALAVAALDRFWELGADLRKPLQDESLDPVERLQAHFRLLDESLTCERFERGCLIGNFSAELAGTQPVSERLAAMYASWTDSMATCVAAAIEAGRSRLDAPAPVVAAFLVSAWEGAVLRAKVERDPRALEDFRTVVFGSLFA